MFGSEGKISAGRTRLQTKLLANFLRPRDAPNCWAGDSISQPKSFYRLLESFLASFAASINNKNLGLLKIVSSRSGQIDLLRPSNSRCPDLQL